MTEEKDDRRERDTTFLFLGLLVSQMWILGLDCSDFVCPCSFSIQSLLFPMVGIMSLIVLYFIERGEEVR